MFRPGFKPAALRLAKDMDIKRVTPLDGITKAATCRAPNSQLIIGG